MLIAVKAFRKQKSDGVPALIQNLGPATSKIDINMPITKKQSQLDSLEQWEALAGPKSPDQWKDGRSAKEAARAWLEGRGIELPLEVATALNSHADFGAVLSWDAEPEVQMRFDGFAGEPRNSDVVVRAKDEHGPYLIAVEAKADEPFGETVADALAAALERLIENPRSNGITRVEQLVQALLGPRQKGEAHIKKIRYQLLTACAGVISEAQRHRFPRALMLVQEFVSAQTADENHARNAQDLNQFVERLSHGALRAIKVGEILGPFPVPGTPLFEESPSLYIGKVSRNIRHLS